MEEIESFLKKLGVGRRLINDPFLENAHTTCKVFERKGVIVEDEEELCHQVMKEFTCNACNATFEKLLDYELHYHDFHHFVCAECKKWRPTARLLEIHIQETHDNFFKVLAEKQPMYQCFVSECDLKFKSPIERREHCREIHAFPKNYRFDEVANSKSQKDSEKDLYMDVDKPVKKKDSKFYFGTNSKQKTFTKKSNNLIEPTNFDADNSKPEIKVSPATMFVPRQVLQKCYAQNLTKHQSMEKNVLESGSIMELGESLPNT